MLHHTLSLFVTGYDFDLDVVSEYFFGTKGVILPKGSTSMTRMKNVIMQSKFLFGEWQEYN